METGAFKSNDGLLRSEGVFLSLVVLAFRSLMFAFKNITPPSVQRRIVHGVWVFIPTLTNSGEGGGLGRKDRRTHASGLKG